MFYLFLACYAAVHLHFEYRFWVVGDAAIFAKYAGAEGPAGWIPIAERVYYAKATWCVALVLLQGLFRVRFHAALAYSFLLYGVQLLLFFPFRVYALLNLLLALGMVIEVHVRRGTAPENP
jgi:hypothetical protein